MKNLRVAPVFSQVIPVIDSEVGQESLEFAWPDEQLKDLDGDLAEDPSGKSHLSPAQGGVPVFGRPEFVAMHSYFRVILPAQVGAVAAVIQIAMRHNDEPEVSRPAPRVFQFPLKADAVSGKPRVNQDIARVGPQEVAIDSPQPDTSQAHGKFNGPDARCFLIPPGITGPDSGLPPARGPRGGPDPGRGRGKWR